MTPIPVTHPGKLGDLLWALPTVRELAKQHGPVQLWLPPQCEPLATLLYQLPYIREVVIDSTWVLGANTPEAPAKPPGELPNVIHLGYPEWPTCPLPFYTALQAGIRPEPSWEPWVEAEPLRRLDGEQVLLYAWTDNWFELKLGMTEILVSQLPITAWTLRTDPQSARWPIYKHAHGARIEELARHIATAALVVTDCSMAMVLTAALGKRCVVMEPEPARHHPIFWPGNTQDVNGHWWQADNQFGRLIWPVIGGDGKPTFDARHTKDLIMELLRA
jgi:hypothetical protein